MKKVSTYDVYQSPNSLLTTTHIVSHRHTADQINQSICNTLPVNSDKWLITEAGAVYFTDKHFIDSTFHRQPFRRSSFCRQYVLPTVHFADSSFCRQYISPTVHFADSHFVDSTFNRQYILSTGHFADSTFHWRYISSTVISPTVHFSAIIHFADGKFKALMLTFALIINVQIS